MRLALLLSVLLAALPARAANRRSFFFGGQAAMTAGGLIAGAHDPGALFYNPAALAGLGGNKLDLSLTAFNLRLQTLKDGLVVQLPGGDRSQDLSGTEINPVPSALTYARKARDGLGFAYGVLVTNAEDLRFDGRITATGVTDPRLPGPVDTATGINAEELATSYLFGAGVGWQGAKELALGGSLFVSYARTITYVQAFSSATLQDRSGSSSYVVTTSNDVKVLGLLPVLSAVWSPAQGLDAGVTVRPLHLALYTWGQRAPLAFGPGLNGGTVFQADRQDLGQGVFQLTEPPSAEAMISYAGDRFAAGGTFEVVAPMKTGGALPIDTRLQWNLRLGASLRFSDSFTGGLGLYTDRSIDASDVARGIDYTGFTLGVATRTALGEARTVFFTTTVAGGYALGNGQSDRFRMVALGGPSDLTLEAVDATFHELTLNVASGLEF